MVFSSLEFLYFYLPAVMLLYLFCPLRFRNALLFASGIVFYSFGEPVYVLVMLLSCAIDYFAGILMQKYDSDARARKLCLAVSVAMNLGLLGVFKYTPFVVSNINALFGTSLRTRLPLPIGISFFTFQSMSYTIDLYRRKIDVQRSFTDFAAYVTMFPQIVAGPIVRYSDVAEQLKSRTITVDSFSTGVSRFVRGLAKKVLLANNVGRLWAEVKAADYAAMPALTAWLGIVAFTLQIYFDFSGYSDMAVGLGRMLGFDFPENFDLPYTSCSVREFWRRWHKTLGEWFKNYVYIPLGGSRGTVLKTVRNLAIVWLLTGLWHGASWNFVLWGAWFGVLIIAERLFLGNLLDRLPGFFAWLYTILAVILGWVLFETPDVGSAISYVLAMFGASGELWNNGSFWLLSEYSIVISLCVYFASDAPGNFREMIEKRLSRAGLRFSVFSLIEPVVTLLLLIASTAYLVNQGYNPFLYFNF